MIRLVRPVVPLAAVWLVVAVALGFVGVSGASRREATRIVGQPLAFAGLTVLALVGFGQPVAAAGLACLAAAAHVLR